MNITATIVASSLRARLAVLAFVLAPVAMVQAATADPLGPGDSIRVTVFQNPDLTTEARIATDGTINLALIGSVNLKGQSTTEAAATIANRLRSGQYLTDPQVNVALLQVRSRMVSVLGQVARPGRYALEEGTTRLTDVIALAGGIAATGDEMVTVMSNRDGKATQQIIQMSSIYRGQADANIEIGNGDTVFVDRAPVFYIYGEVQRAGAYRLESNLNVMQAVSLGGGITLRGTQRGMKIHRRGADGSLARLDVGPGDVVQPNDVIYVSESLF